MMFANPVPDSHIRRMNRFLIAHVLKAMPNLKNFVQRYPSSNSKPEILNRETPNRYGSNGAPKAL